MTIEEIIMPSLYGTTVANNYGRMTAQQTYGVGAKFSNFGTRQYRLIKVVATASDGTTAVDFTDASATALSDFSKAVRAIQTVAEINQIFTPGTAGFLVMISADTVNDIDSGNGGQAGEAGTYGYGVLEAAIKAALAKGGSATVTVSTVDVNSTGTVLA